jgi:hypothetical protein
VIGIVAELKLKMTSDVNEKSPKLYNFFLGTRELELILNNCFGESAVTFSAFNIYVRNNILDIPHFSK